MRLSSGKVQLPVWLWSVLVIALWWEHSEHSTSNYRWTWKTSRWVVIWLQEMLILILRPSWLTRGVPTPWIQGYLAYLSSGNVDEMYRVMWECGKLTREDLGKMCDSAAASVWGNWWNPRLPKVSCHVQSPAKHGEECIDQLQNVCFPWYICSTGSSLVWLISWCFGNGSRFGDFDGLVGYRNWLWSRSRWPLFNDLGNLWDRVCNIKGPFESHQTTNNYCSVNQKLQTRNFTCLAL